MHSDRISMIWINLQAILFNIQLIAWQNATEKKHVFHRMASPMQRLDIIDFCYGPFFILPFHSSFFHFAIKKLVLQFPNRKIIPLILDLMSVWIEFIVKTLKIDCQAHYICLMFQSITFSIFFLSIDINHQLHKQKKTKTLVIQSHFGLTLRPLQLIVA